MLRKITFFSTDSLVDAKLRLAFLRQSPARISLGRCPHFSVQVMSGATMCFVRFLLGVVFPFTKVAGIPRLWQRLGYVGYGFGLLFLSWWAGKLSTSRIEVFAMFSKTRYFSHSEFMVLLSLSIVILTTNSTLPLAPLLGWDGHELDASWWASRWLP